MRSRCVRAESYRLLAGFSYSAAALLSMLVLAGFSRASGAPASIRATSPTERALKKTLHKCVIADQLTEKLPETPIQMPGVVQAPIITEQQRMQAKKMYAEVVATALSRIKALDVPMIDQRFELLSPCGGELAAIGDTVEVAWRAEKTIQCIIVEVAAEESDEWLRIREIQNSGAGSVRWVVPSRLPDGATMPARCRLRIRTPDYMHKVEAGEALTISTVSDRAAADIPAHMQRN